MRQSHKERTLGGRLAAALTELFLLILLASLLTAFFTAARPRRSLLERERLALTFHLPHLREEYVTDVHIGDRLLDAVGKRVLGDVCALSLSPAMTETYDREGGAVRRVPYPHRVSLVLTVVCLAVRGEDGLTVSGLSLRRGAHIPLRLPNLVGEGILTAITPL